MPLILTLEDPFKDPSAILDYTFNWRPSVSDVKKGPYLAEDEDIAVDPETGEKDITITYDAGLTLIRFYESDGRITVWLSGGEAEHDYLLSCSIKTTQGRTDKRSTIIRVKER